MDGCFIGRVSVTGDGLEEAYVDLADGLNVIFGASDTGKSYLASIIDFALGASTRPRAIDAARGYTTVSLTLHSRAGGSFRIERPFASERPFLYTRQDDNGVEIAQEMRLGNDDESLSRRLLSITGFPPCLTVRKNLRNVRRRFSFRDVAHVCIIDETRIISELPPHLTPNRVENTAQGEVLRLIVTGRGDATAARPTAGAREGVAGRREAL